MAFDFAQGVALVEVHVVEVQVGVHGVGAHVAGHHQEEALVGDQDVLVGVLVVVQEVHGQVVDHGQEVVQEEDHALGDLEYAPVEVLEDHAGHFHALMTLDVSAVDQVGDRDLVCCQVFQMMECDLNLHPGNPHWHLVVLPLHQDVVKEWLVVYLEFLEIYHHH